MLEKENCFVCRSDHVGLALYVIWVPGGALASQDETGVEIHTKERTDTDDGDYYSAEKHV